MSPVSSSDLIPMLAYVFWHWRRAEVSAPEYERLQRAFHDALAAAPSPGFHRSFTHALRGAPWAAGGAEAYEDWYLVADSAALDPLNEAAVTAGRQRPHDAAAAAAANGAAGLYRLRMGDAPSQPRHAYWFAKPAGVGYAETWRILAPAVDRGAAVWVRQMVLGPTPEFCLHSAVPVDLPPELAPIALDLRPIWPEGEGG